MSSSPLKIFINYRRDDRPKIVKSIRDGFVLRYREDNVFMDLDIPNFSSFPDHLKEKVKEADVLVAFIGPRWLDLLNDRAGRDEPDYLVDEIAQALCQRHTMVATICIGGADIPRKSDLPENIQDMLEYQIPHFQNDEENFLGNISKVMNDIEKELERRGFQTERSRDLGEVLSMPFDDLENYIFNLLEAEKTLRIEKHLGEFPGYFLGKISEIDDVPNDEISAFTVFGLVFIKYNQFELYQKYLRSLQDIFDEVSKRNPFRNNIERKIWYEILRMLYLLGAMIVSEKKFEWLSNLIKYQVERKPEPFFWVKYMQISGLPIGNLNRLIAFMVDEIASSTDSRYFFQQFLNEEGIIDKLCQFDFLHCLIDSGAAFSENKNFIAWPYFRLYHLDRIVPIMDRMINQTQLRHKLLGSKFTDEQLATTFAECVSHSMRVYGPFTIWRDRMPDTISRFLEANPTKEVKAVLRYK